MRALGFAIVGATVLFTAESGRFEPPSGPAVEAHAALVAGLGQAEKSATSVDQQISDLTAAVSRAVKLLEPYSPAYDQLQALLPEAANDLNSQRYEELKKTVASVARELAFVPKYEASLPAGFPTYTPVGVIEVKKYPEYRMASGDGFWTLFQHIQQNQIEMTAPVQMNFASGDQGEIKQSKMSFLYGRPEIGSPGVHGKVDVVDADEHWVVSLGMRGSRSKESLIDARERLQQWIRNNQNYEASGTMRVMGYNSPAVPRANQFFEVQIPLKKITEAASTSDAS